MSDLYHVSSSPHVRAKDSTDRIMLYVIIALLPASLFGIYNFGFRALFIILLTIASCVASEWVFDYIVKKKSTITDLSAVVTGLLLALNLPVALPWWGGCTRWSICNHHCQVYVRRTRTELYEPGTWWKMLPSHRICG